MALLRAAQLGVEPAMLAVLDQGTAPKTGGTAENVKRWVDRGNTAEILELSGMREDIKPAAASPTPDPVARATGQNRSHRIARNIRTMLFGDVVGFSKLGEEAAPSFFVEFLGQVAQVIESSDPQPETCNTWGDGLYIVFADVIPAARFALQLRDMVVNKDWSTVGLPVDTNIRLGMHAGPVYGAIDPIIERYNYFGSHVNRAARIEPITTPGSIFLTEQTASLLAASGDGEFECDYLGVMDLAKKYGSGALYRLRRTNEIE